MRAVTALLALACVVAVAERQAAAEGTHARYEGEAAIGFLFTDCPELGRAGLAIRSCVEQRPDYAGVLAGRGRLTVSLGETLEVALEERLRFVAPRSHPALTSADASSELSLRWEPSVALVVTGAAAWAQHVEPETRWQYLRYAGFVSADWAGPLGLSAEARLETALADFVLDHRKNTYASVDARLHRAAGRLKLWATPWLRAALSGDAAVSTWGTNLGELLEELVNLDGTPRRDTAASAEAEVAVRPVPSLLLAASARYEVNGSNVPLFRYRAYGPALHVSFASGGHTLSATVRYLRYDFPEALIARGRFANTREDNHVEVHVRHRTEISERVGLDLSFSWTGNDSSDATIFDALCARPDGAGCDGAEGRAEVLSSITSYSRYAQGLLEAKVYVRW